MFSSPSGSSTSSSADEFWNEYVPRLLRLCGSEIVGHAHPPNVA